MQIGIYRQCAKRSHPTSKSVSWLSSLPVNNSYRTGVIFLLVPSILLICLNILATTGCGTDGAGILADFTSSRAAAATDENQFEVASQLVIFDSNLHANGVFRAR